MIETRNVVPHLNVFPRKLLRMYRHKWKALFKKVIFVICIFKVSLLIIACNSLMFHWNGRTRENLMCLNLPGNKLPQLNETEPKLGAGIYFHETSCPENLSDIHLNARQACSIESALRAHPHTDVFLLITSPIFKYLEETKNILIRQLLSYKNFKLRHIKFSEYLSNTPLKVIHNSGALQYSRWPVSHSSDVLRYATLYKFGGIYLDLDVIVLKPLTGFQNFAGAESNTSLGSGVLGFGINDIGREVATECAKELASTYKGRDWGFNGPGVITRVLKKKCKTEEIPKMIEGFCNGFNVYPTEYFAAIPFRNYKFFFQEGNTEKAHEILNRSYAIHYWNNLSSQYVLRNNSNIPFLNYAKKYCPNIYKVTSGNF